MKRRVIAQLNWKTATERDTFKNRLEGEVLGMKCYDRRVDHRKDVDGNYNSSVDIRAEKTADADRLYSFIKGEMDRIPALSGIVYWHDCRHDEPYENWEPGEPQEKYETP